MPARDPARFTDTEKANLKFLYEEWAHPHFVSIEEYVRLMEGTDKMATVGSANWVKNTIRSWRHSIWVGVGTRGPWCSRAEIWYRRSATVVTLERMHRAFDCDLMTYGMMKGKKKPAATGQRGTDAVAVGSERNERGDRMRRVVFVCQ